MQTKKGDEPTVYLLDSNGIYDTPRIIERLGSGGNIVVIPYRVLRELDDAKRGGDTIAFNVREAHRILDKLREGRKIYSSVRAALAGEASFDNGGRVVWGRPSANAIRKYSEEVSLRDPMKKDDWVIITALDVRDNANGLKTVLVSDDDNILLVGDSFGLDTEHLRYGRVQMTRPDELYSGVVEVTVKGSVMDEFFRGNGLDKAVSVETLVEGSDEKNHERLSKLAVNQGVVMRPEGEQEFSVVTRYNAESNSCECLKYALFYDPRKGPFDALQPKRTWGMVPGDPRQILYMDFLLDPGIYFVAVNGRHGTGKTKLLLAGALQNLFGNSFQTTDGGKRVKQSLRDRLNKRFFEGLFLLRPEVGTGDFDPGTVPGGLARKTEQYFKPLHRAIDDIGRIVRASNLLQQLRDGQLIEELVTTFLRGINLEGSFVCVDEAQNADRALGKAIITRSGETAKTVMCGDVFQIDAGQDPKTRRSIGPNNNALSLLTDGLRREHRPHAAAITLTRNYRGGASTLADLLDEVVE